MAFVDFLGLRWPEEAGDSLLDKRDHSGARIATGCKLKVSDFQQDGDEATVRFHLKGGRVKTKGIHSGTTNVSKPLGSRPAIGILMSRDVHSSFGSKMRRSRLVTVPRR